MTLDGVITVSPYILQASDVFSVIFPLVVLFTAKSLNPRIVLLISAQEVIVEHRKAGGLGGDLIQFAQCLCVSLSLPGPFTLITQ